MLHKTNGIVLRSVKYGETSLIITVFTALFGIQTFMVQGVRSAKTGRNKAAFFQPATLLELVIYHHPEKNMQRLREYQCAYIYTTLQENVVKNSIVLFSVELLLRLLPEHAPLPALFDFVYEYFTSLDKMPITDVANFPLYFIMECSRSLGYELKGNYNIDTTETYLQEKEHANMSFANNGDAVVFNQLIQAGSYDALKQIEMNSAMRLRLIDWFIAFLRQYAQHLGNIRSLSVLRAILH